MSFLSNKNSSVIILAFLLLVTGFTVMSYFTYKAQEYADEMTSISIQNSLATNIHEQKVLKSQKALQKSFQNYSDL
ncbi:MAG: hypothetical protein NTV72_03185 [Candidatus Taylorbacteria bacterium]|nr:hypothetical protein [Candidatus Taylorbacteria bacterium]